MLNRSYRSILLDIIINLSFSVLLFIVTYVWIAQPHEVSGASMEPTLLDKDYVVTERVSLYIGLLDRFDVIVFNSPIQKNIQLIKRVIAVPNDIILISSGNVYINGEMLVEQYVNGETYGGDFLQEGEEYTLGADEYFLLGDNRLRSSDSRSWGPINKGAITGVAIIRYWPLKRFTASL